MRHSAWRQRRIGLLCGCAAQRGEGTSAADGGAQRSARAVWSLMRGGGRRHSFLSILKTQ